MNDSALSINKISPPTLGEVVMRDRLFELFTQPHPSSAFWIAGPGGSGKTTLVASYLNKNNLPCLWYQVDRLDKDPATFFYYLGQAAAPLFAPGSPPLPLLTPEYFPDIKTFIVRYFEKLFQDLQSPCWIIFDNFHEAPDDSLIQQIASTAIEMLPQNISMAIISRNDLPPSMARLRANQALQVINWSKISFTAEETNQLINLHHCPLDDKETDRLHRFTQGWAAGIILWLLQLERSTDISNLPRNLSLENIFDYFAGEILDKANPEIIDFFFKTALFPYMTPDMATQLTGMESMELLEDLNRRNCFLEKRLLLEASYQYHPLFREFLLSRSIRHFTPESLKNLNIRAAEILTDKNFVEEAIDLYSEAKEYKPLIKLLLAQAPVLISQGRHQRLTNWIELLPAELTEKNPWLLFWHGLGLLPSHPREGQECCIRAYELFSQLDDLPGRIYSWSTIIETFLILRAVITPLDYWISEGEKLETLVSDKLDINLVGRFTGSMFAALVLRNPGHPKILKYQSQCEKFLQQCTDEQILAVLSTHLTISYFWFGQIHKSKLMLASLQPPDPTRVSPVIILGYHTIRCLLLLSQGNWTQCQEIVKETITIAKESGIHIYDSILLTNGVYSGLLVGDLDTANRFLQRVKKSLLPQALFDVGQYHFARAWYKTEKGLFLEAASECEIANGLAQKSGHPFAIGCTTLLLAQLYLENDEVDQAVQELEHLRDNPRLHNCNQIHFSMHLILADCAFSQNRSKAGYSHLKTAFSQISEDGVTVPLGLVRERLAFLCAEALNAEIETETVKAFVKLVQLSPPSKTSVGEEWPWPVRIYVLGQLEVYHFDEKLILSKKTPAKVLELLKLLIATGKTKHTRESVADRLWPDSDGDKAMQNLSTTTHRLRKLLRFPDPVISEKGRLFLNSKICWIDSYYFADLLKQASQVKQLVQKSEQIRQILSVYRGGFDLGQNYNSVIVGYAEQLRKQWENFVVHASRELMLTNHSQEAIGILNDFLNFGGNVRQIYKMLINFFYDGGRLKEAMMIYEQYETVIMKSGEVPDDELKAIYKIMSKN